MTDSIGSSPALSSLRLEQGGAMARAEEGSLERALRRADGGDPKEAATAFQSVLATLLVKELRRALPEGMFGKGPGADVYEGWFDEHLGRTLAERDTLGMREMLRAELARRQEARDAGRSVQGARDAGRGDPGVRDADQGDQEAIR